jgi:hypothetical protein
MVLPSLQELDQQPSFGGERRVSDLREQLRQAADEFTSAHYRGTYRASRVTHITLDAIWPLISSALAAARNETLAQVRCWAEADSFELGHSGRDVLSHARLLEFLSQLSPEEPQNG